ncbi:MAG: hypothetical protein U0904_03855 [Candidatus Nanopelagicales bacterium]|nr:hypothetical protein [Candidatus Nanopelagicales bacterium]
MSNVPIRELRNSGGAVADRVLAGEHVTVTRAGKPIMELTALPRPPLSGPALIERWRNVAAIDLVRLRADMAEVMEDSV